MISTTLRDPAVTGSMLGFASLFCFFMATDNLYIMIIVIDDIRDELEKSRTYSCD